MRPDRQVVVILTSHGHIIIPTITSPQNTCMVHVPNEMAAEEIYPEFFIASAGEENTLKKREGNFMTNNDILRRLRDTFNFDDSKMISIFGLADHKVTCDQICDWLKTEGDPTYRSCNDSQLAMFLNGLINDMRGKKEGPPAVPEESINNNIVLVKLKIALNLQAEDILNIFDLVDVHISKHELSAFFRKPVNKHYRACKDQILCNFLKGVQRQYRENR